MTRDIRCVSPTDSYSAAPPSNRSSGLYLALRREESTSRANASVTCSRSAGGAKCRPFGAPGERSAPDQGLMPQATPVPPLRGGCGQLAEARAAFGPDGAACALSGLLGGSGGSVLGLKPQALRLRPSGAERRDGTWVEGDPGRGGHPADSRRIVLHLFEKPPHLLQAPERIPLPMPARFWQSGRWRGPVDAGAPFLP
jgi:hypothetical protein